MISNQTSTEIFELFELLGENEKKKIPMNFWNLIEKNKYKVYDKKQIQKNLINGIMNEDTRNLYGALKLKYLCDDDLEKKILFEIYTYNARIKKENNEKMIKVNINTDIFGNNKKNPQEKIKQQKMEMIECKKEKWYKKIFDKIF